MTIIKTFSISNVQSTGEFVSDQMFGANALHDINIDTTGAASPSFVTAISEMGVTDIRYPGGFAEVLGDILEGGTSTSLNPRLVNFLDWVKSENANGAEYTVTLGIPTKSFIDYDLIRNFARMIGDEYSDIVSGIELGNEYSIGTDTITEKSYGARADLATRALDDGFRDAGLSANQQPDIIIQMAEIFGRGSAYKGTGEHYEANVAIIEQLSTQTIQAVDGVVNHYYYAKDHNGDDSFATSTADINFETRHLFVKTEAWEQAWNDLTNRADLELSVTEWNIQKMNADQLGLKGAGTMLKQFEYMLEMGATMAHAWPIQHKTGNALAGNPGEDADLSPAAGLFSLMSNNLTSEDPMELIDLRLNTSVTGIETTAFQSDDKSVIYISSRDDKPLNFNINLSQYNKPISSTSAAIIGLDAETSNGLSEMGDVNNQNRVAKRKIDFEEYQELKKLAFFDENNGAHISISINADGTKEYKTYLPEPDNIIPLTDAPRTIEDYYFATETDVSYETELLSQSDLGGTDFISFTLDAYEVIEITLDHSPTSVPPVVAPPAPPVDNEGRSLQLNTISLDLFRDTMDGEKSVSLYSAQPLQSSMDPEAQSILGSDNPDIVATGIGDDYIRGNEGDDVLISGSGNDSITGSGGNDTLYGGLGDDVIYGNQNNDVLIPGQGNDILDGGFGADTFVFSMPEGPEVDIIQDFNLGQDRIEFHNFELSNRLGQFNDIQIVDAGNDTDIKYRDYTLRLENIDAADISLSDIYFF